jgi:ubiquinone/menaquinone biosynthesis C-methylase UbiE
MAVPLARDYEVTLCDVSPRMLRLAEMAADADVVPTGHFSTQLIDAVKPLPFADASFDQVLCIDLLVHLPDPVSTLRELRRVLKADGKLLVDTTNHSGWWLPGYPRYVGKRPGRWLQTWRGGGVLPEWQNVVKHHTRREFWSMLKAGGFAIDEEWSYGPRWCSKCFLARCRAAESSQST